MANGRCKRHGGKSTGAHNPKSLMGVDNGAYTHGLYTKFFREDEKTLIDAGAVRIGEVESEIIVMKIRLKRALEAREKWDIDREAGNDGEDHMSLVEVTDGEAVAAEGEVVPVSKRVKRLPDFDKIIDVTIARIESLAKTRKALLEENPDKDNDGEGGSGGGSGHTVTLIGGLTGTDGPLPSPFDES